MENNRWGVTLKVKEKVMEKYDWKCYVCGNKKVALEIHHITPREYGGKNNIANLVPLCHSCHSAIHRDEIETCIVNAVSASNDELKAKKIRISNMFMGKINSCEKGFKTTIKGK